MKRNLFLMPFLAIVCLASCSKDESMSTNNGHMIDFRTAMETRATETTNANIKSFYVTALDKNNANYFSDVKFEKSENVFISAPVYYWPSDGSNLTFFAYSPSASDLGAAVVITSKGKNLTNFSPAKDIAGQKDFITATATGSKKNESTGVALKFKHQLAQIEIKAKNSNEGYVYKVQGVRIGKPVSKASFNFDNSTWSLSSEKTNYEVTYSGSEKTLTGTAASIMKKSNDNAMLIPQQLTAWNASAEKTNASKGAYLAVKVQISTAAGAQVFPATKGGYDWVAVPIDTKWQAGQKYVYTLDFSNGAGQVDPEKPTPEDPGTDPFNPGGDILGSAIKFTVDVSSWTTASKNVNM